MDMWKYGVSGFKVGKSVEGAFDEATQKIMQLASQPPAPPAPDPMIEVEKMKLEAKAQEAQISASIDERKAAAQLQHEQMRSQNDIAIEQAKIQEQMELERWKAQLDSETELQKVQLQVEAEKEIEQFKAQNEAAICLREQSMELNRVLDTAKSTQGNEQSNVLVAGLQAVIESLNKPKVVLRDGNGRVTGVAPQG
jgi:hypothetical protein